MKKRTACLALAVLLISAACASADTTTREKIRDAVVTVSPIMSQLCLALRDVGGAIASLIFIWAAVQWITSRDEPAKRNKARDTMIAVIIGIVILGLSISVVNGVITSMNLNAVNADFC